MTRAASSGKDKAGETTSPQPSTPITNALAPDLEAVRRFLLEMIARRAFAELVAAVLSLLARMRDLNTELMAKVAGNCRHRPAERDDAPAAARAPASGRAGGER